MAVKLDGVAPYAPSTAIIEFIGRNRSGGLPSPVTLQTLERLGISESLRPRTLQALKLLDYIDDAGEVTAEFSDLRKVSTPEYLPKLAEMLRSSYADVFEIVDPSGASYEQVKDAFRGFKPPGQLDRMVSLFLALLGFTGEWSDLPAARRVKLTPVRNGSATSARPKKSLKKLAKPAVKTLPLPQPARERSSDDDDSEVLTTKLGPGGAIHVDTSEVNWLKLPKDSFLRLRELIDEIGSLGDGGES